MQVVFSDRWCASVIGEVDADNCADFAEALRSGTRSGDTLTVDLAQMTFIDSSGISTVLKIKAELEGDGAVLVLKNPTDSVKRILEITGLLATFGLSD